MNTTNQELTTKIKKSDRGLQADTDISLSDKLEIGVLSYKRSNGYLVTIVTVSTIEGAGIYTMKSHKLFSDYNKTWAESKVTRLTEKVLLSQHNKILEQLEAIKEDVKNFYLNK